MSLFMVYVHSCKCCFPMNIVNIITGQDVFPQMKQRKEPRNRFCLEGCGLLCFQDRKKIRKIENVFNKLT